MAANPCMGCRAAGLPKCDIACERATAYDAIRRQGREQVYAELRRVDPTWHGSKTDFVTDLIGDVQARLDPDFRLDIEARASGPDVARLGSWIDDGFRVGETREYIIPGVDANPGTMRITGITDTVLTVESGPAEECSDGFDECTHWCDNCAEEHGICEIGRSGYQHNAKCRCACHKSSTPDKGADSSNRPRVDHGPVLEQPRADQRGVQTGRVSPVGHTRGCVEMSLDVTCACPKCGTEIHITREG